MSVNFEFLGPEPIENVITCIHYKIDRVVYFGYHKEIENLRERTESFLKEHCNVQTVVFHELSKNDLQSVLKTMRNIIRDEKSLDKDVFFDITGGESLVLVAFGMLAEEFKAPMHTFDIPKNRLIELESNAVKTISRTVKPNDIKMDLEKYIKMQGGIINRNLHKSIKNPDNEELLQDIEKIWTVTKQYEDLWNPFSNFLNKLSSGNSLSVNENVYKVLSELKASDNKLKNINDLNLIIDGLAGHGILLNVRHRDGVFRFTYKNEDIKNCILENGSILELHTYIDQRKKESECLVGVHLDWDGEIHESSGDDVVNEIDVLSLKGLVPTFISCKSGRMSKDNTLNALYELDTVARRFGGKHAKKVLVSMSPIGDTYLIRAGEMGIDVRKP